ncbi:MAG TPA: response regulator, partial [Candidatus Sericytochromatia bacterium]
KILVVDDEADSRDLIAFVLEQAGAEVIALSSAIEVLQFFQHTQADLLISDIGMPDMDGYMLLQQVRTLPRQDKQIPAIALTAYAGEYDQKQAITAGFKQHMSKPIDPEKLIEAIAQALTLSG